MRIKAVSQVEGLLDLSQDILGNLLEKNRVQVFFNMH